jgi:hypothetical protein
MTAHPPPQNPRLNPKTLRMMRKRREWRRRALKASVALCTWPSGKPGRQEIEAETIKSLNKVWQWFRAPKAQVVVLAIQRRAMAAFRNQFDSTQPCRFHQ